MRNQKKWGWMHHPNSTPTRGHLQESVQCSFRPSPRPDLSYIFGSNIGFRDRGDILTPHPGTVRQLPFSQGRIDHCQNTTMCHLCENLSQPGKILVNMQMTKFSVTRTLSNLLGVIKPNSSQITKVDWASVIFMGLTSRPDSNLEWIQAILSNKWQAYSSQQPCKVE